MSSFRGDSREKPHFVTCTLCSKHQLDVARLVQATANIFVCVECIDLMHALVHGYEPADPPPPLRPLKDRLQEFFKRQKDPL